MPTLAPIEELCRRIAVDLTGLVPTKEEIAANCAGKTASQIADTYFATPDYLVHEKAHWAQHLRWDPSRVNGRYLVDADKILDRLAKGEDGYDVFAKKIMAHPAFAVGSRQPLSTADSAQDQPVKLFQVGLNAFRVFLGRTALPDEAQEFGKLYGGWLKAYVPFNGGVGRWDAYLAPAGCAGTLGTNACSTTLFGTLTSVNIDLSQQTLYDNFNGNVPSALQAQLEKPGALLVTQPEFWDEVVDHAFLRLTGYWKTTRAEPDTDIPEARAAASAAFRALPSHDYRELLKMIVSSTLYTRTSAVDPSKTPDPALYCTGPLKPMAPDDYVRSMGKILGRNTGRCDYHTSEAPGASDTADVSPFFPDSLRSDMPGEAALGATYHYSAAAQIGGCRGGQPVPIQPGLAVVFGTVGIADQLCGAGAVFAPADFDANDTSDANVKRLVDYQFDRFLARSPEDAERAAFNKEAATCLGDAQCGMAKLPGRFCVAILRSVAFLYF
jgi:hypothetical protein